MMMMMMMMLLLLWSSMGILIINVVVFINLASCLHLVVSFFAC